LGLKLKGTAPPEDELPTAEQLERVAAANTNKLNPATSLAYLTLSDPNTIGSPNLDD
jgi:hypothetical protein